MTREKTKDTGETTQIAILTLAMTAGCFALLTLWFFLFGNPSASSDAARMESDYASLAKLLQGPEMKDLRRQAKIAESKDNTKDVRTIVQECLDRFGLKYPSFQRANPKDVKPGLQAVHQPISTEPAKLQDLISFIAAVKDAKKTIQVESARFQRDPKSKVEDGLWTVSVELVDYVSTGTAAAPAAGPASPPKE